ncbi:helix-turn-helix domain-containing protein [Streptomyces sp. NBC_00212]|uniref:helix-turn-helix domain-containing protein n=1 Tax=Streptomyces sp. NBC_00212 TaxID=2975684 RepID=UPI002F917F31
MTTVRIIECTAPDELYRRYDQESKAQAAYIELDLREGTLLADYNAEVGNATPFSVYYGFERRYSIPALTAEAANRVMREIAPFADRILADWEQDLDRNGNNVVARLGEDAEAAEEEIIKHLGEDDGYDTFGLSTQGFDPSDLVTEWDVDGATNGSEAEDYDITADTTDARLDEIEQEILSDLAGCGEGSVIVCPGLDDYLRSLRDELAEDDPLTPAELRTAREALGLTGDHLAKRLGVNPRTLRSWEQGRDAIPGRIRPEIAELKEATTEAVKQLVAEVAGGDEQSEALITYRNDEEYLAAHPGGRWSASWHRQVCARAAEETGARIDYADAEGDDEE